LDSRKNQPVKRYKKKSNPFSFEEANRTNPILPQTQGFLITYNRLTFARTKKFGTLAIDLLNHYADKVYRTEEKSCYFKQRSSDLPPVFIETDIADPSILVDAIYTDLLAPADRRCEDVKTAVGWSRFMPVNMTCTTDDDDMMNRVKEVVKPVFVEQPTANVLKYKITIKGKIIGKARIKKLREGVTSYLTSSVEHVQDSNPDVEIWIHIMGQICCISLMKNAVKFKDYKIPRIVKS